MGNQNFIEINGKKYDITTGKMLGQTQKTPVTERIQPQNSGSVDGFSKRPAKRLSNERQVASHATKKPQKSQTLMRNVVKKPNPRPKSNQHVHEIQKPTLKPPARRVANAQQITKSTHIRKFEDTQSRSSVVKKHAELDVKPAPRHSVSNTPHPQTRVNNNQQVQGINRDHESHSQKLLNSALANAQSHTTEHHHPKQKKRSKLAKKLGVSSRALAASSAVLAAVLLGGFFAMQNVPNFSMRVAATRAGFEARMPGYKPSGFSFRGPINYTPGQVVVSFSSNSDNRAYVVKQSSSNWNSDALLSNFIESENKQYQTYIERGRTMFIYEGSNATWVDNGIWYQIEGESDLTTDQLIRIASSL